MHVVTPVDDALKTDGNTKSVKQKKYCTIRTSLALHVLWLSLLASIFPRMFFELYLDCRGVRLVEGVRRYCVRGKT